MITGKKISFCWVGYFEDNCYFSFPYDDKTLYTKRDSLLLKKTNTYLKLKDKFLPVVSTFDECFSNIPRTQGYINDFNYCSVYVNRRGELLSHIEY